MYVRIPTSFYVIVFACWILTALIIALLLAPVARRATFDKTIPKRPLPGQATPPCPTYTFEIGGGCYSKVLGPDGKQATGCLDSDVLYDHEGLCWAMAMLKKKRTEAETR